VNGDIEKMRPQLDAFIKLALEEDIREGDHSTLSSIPESKEAKARLLVKEDAIIAGMELASYLFQEAFPNKKIRFTPFVNDGDLVKKGDIAFEIEGPVHKILMLERLVLNCMQRMSGIATATKKLTSLISDLPTKLLDTRKTTPGIRFLEKWAVRIGGGYNHRTGLYDMILLKDNHIDAAGGIEKAVMSANNYLKKQNLHLPIEVETRNLEEVKQVMAVDNVQRIMLDNFSPDEIRKALTLIGGKIETEASGGITADNLRDYALTGVDYISTSQTIHSVKSIDLSLKISD
jgi:nicotinate-nucleotide pyrophosphorylase (carboxylating)